MIVIDQSKFIHWEWKFLECILFLNEEARAGRERKWENREGGREGGGRSRRALIDHQYGCDKSKKFYRTNKNKTFAFLRDDSEREEMKC